MFQVGVVGEFEAAHRLHGDFGPAARTHGHTYRVEAVARGLALRSDETLFDVTLLQGALDDVLGTLHYRDLDEVDALEGRNTTAEVVAHYLYEAVASRVRGLGLTTLTVRVWESQRVFAGFEGPVE